MHPRLIARLLPPLLALGIVLGAAAAMLVGPSKISPARALAIVVGAAAGSPGDDADTRVLLDIRMPRVLLTLLVGAGMGLAGVAAQTLFRNPLASPYVLGVSNGSALGAVAAMLWVAPHWGTASVPAMSVLGGLLVAATVFGMARRSSRFGHALLLAGIALGAFCSSLTAAALFLAGERLQTLVFWLMGGFWLSTWRDAALMLPVTAAALAVLLLLAPAMNVALTGERSAGDLGVHVRRLQIALLLIAAVATSVAVAVSGVIGFVGLIVPHFFRLHVGADHRRLVPLSAAGGALLLLFADTAARTLAAPAEVPVGILTALLGAPVFLWFLQRRANAGVWP